MLRAFVVALVTCAGLAAGRAEDLRRKPRCQSFCGKRVTLAIEGGVVPHAIYSEVLCGRQST
jgi:hypothetical protein